MDQETRRTGARSSLSAMAATLLACGGAALIAGAPDWVSHMALAQTPLTGSSDPAFSQDLPGLGHKFELFGTAQDAQDPKNPTNDVIATTIAEGRGSSQAQFAGAIRPLPPGVDIATLTDQLDLKYFFVDRTCGGGAPRFQLAIDLDGDGVSDGNAFGYVGNPPGFAGGDDTFPSSPSTAGSPGGVGHAFYDLVTVDDRTLENRQDTVH